MQLQSLTLEGFRNYTQSEIHFQPALNVLIGANAQGKTNLLEAIYYLANGHSFRGNKDAELIGWDAPFLRLSATFQVEESVRVHEMQMTYERNGRKKIKLNGVAYRKVGDVPQRIKVVLFTPDDLTIVKGSPSLRRQFVDRELDAFDEQFYDLRRQYNRVLLQRNELLKEVRARRQSASALQPWTEQLVVLGTQVIRFRLHFLSQLIPAARRIHGVITGQPGTFDVRYLSCLGQVLQMSSEALQEKYREVLSQCAGEEIRCGVSLYGPHRDDLSFYEKGSDLRVYGSQGQQRTAVLAMKLAEVECYQRRFNRQPLLLLDDVMSELDDMRQEQLMGIVLARTIQTVITGTKMDFYRNEQENNPLFYVHEGKITRK